MFKIVVLTSSSVIGLLVLVQLYRKKEANRIKVKSRFFKILILVVNYYNKFTKEGENKLKIF